MNRIYVDPSLGEEYLIQMENIIRFASYNVIAPAQEEGEIVIFYTKEDDWDCLYHATLCGGAGNSCAEEKVYTLIDHPDYYWGGAIPKDELKACDKKRYGSIRLPNCCGLEGSGWKGEMIIAFSGFKEWQDVIVVASLLHVLEDALKMKFDLPPGIDKDTTWSTVLKILPPLLGKPSLQ